MKKKLLVAIFSFLIFFALYSQVLFIRKNEILQTWATEYIRMKTSVSPGEQEAQMPYDDAEYFIMYRVAAACAENLVSNVELIRDTPGSRIPVLDSIEFYGKIFSIDSGMADNVVTYAHQTGYWSKKTDAFKILSEKPLEEIEDSEAYIEWHQHIRDEIVTLKIFEEKGWYTPEELKNEILNYSIQEMPLFKRLFLKPWDKTSKEKTLVLYENYYTHVAADDLPRASADLFALEAIRTGQKQMVDAHIYFFGSDSEYVSAIMTEVATLFVVSSAAACLTVLVLFYRENPVVLAGATLGILAVFVSSAYATVLWFALVGAVAVFLSGRKNIISLDYKKSIIISLKSALIFFLAHYVFNTAFFYAGFRGQPPVQELADFITGFVVSSVLYIGFQVCLLCLLSAIGGLLVYMALNVIKMRKEELK